MIANEEILTAFYYYNLVTIVTRLYNRIEIEISS